MSFKRKQISIDLITKQLVLVEIDKETIPKTEIADRNVMFPNVYFQIFRYKQVIFRSCRFRVNERLLYVAVYYR